MHVPKLDPSSDATLRDVLARRAAHELSHAELLELVASAHAHDRRQQLLAWLRTGGAAPAVSSDAVLETSEALAERGFVAEAWALSEHAAHDTGVAGARADWAMRLGCYEDALAASELAITGLLHDGLTLEEFLRLSARGAPAEGLMRYARSAVVRLRPLHEPIAIRWEALHRVGRTRDAQLVRAACLRLFPDRASVWATAGNHALDAGELALAEHYFERCLQLDRAWTAGLAGLAIVNESRKAWARALVFRKRVVEVERALERDDAPSLQRAMRYAAALARLERWREAEVVFRRCARPGAFACLPAERLVLLSVFSRELYAPALVVACLGQQQLPEAEIEDPARLAIHEAGLLAHVSRELGADRSALGMCAWLAGDAERAYRHFDEAECDGADVAVQYLLLSAASAVAAEDQPSIAQFCERAARDVIARSSDASDEALLYAFLTLAHAQDGTAPACARDDGLLALYREARAGSCEELRPAPELPPLVQLRRVVAFRATQRAFGRSPLMAAASSSAALASIAGAL